MDEKTPHLHATVVPIVTGERKRKFREGEKKYRTQTGPRLSADEVMGRARLSTYQNTYAEAMREFGLQRGVVGSTAKHQSNGEYYRQQMLQYENDIVRLNAEVEKANEGRSAILSLFGKGDLAKAKKDLAAKDEQIAKLKAQIRKLQEDRNAIVQCHKQELAKLKNGYQVEIDKAIKEVEALPQDASRKRCTDSQPISTHYRPRPPSQSTALSAVIRCGIGQTQCSELQQPVVAYLDTCRQ